MSAWICDLGALLSRFTVAARHHGERASGKTVMTSEKEFRRDEVIVFREFQPEIRQIRTQKKIQGLKKGWEEDVYLKEVAEYKLRTWLI